MGLVFHTHHRQYQCVSALVSGFHCSWIELRSGAALGQGYFAWRIHLVGKTLYIPALIMAVPRILCSTSLLLTNIQLQITLVQLGAGVWSGVEICLAKEFSQLQTKNLRPTAVSSSDSTVAEI